MIEATLFVEPVEWPDPVVRYHDGHEQMWGNAVRASTFAVSWRSDMIRKYTRGLCDAHAMACVNKHGGKVLALMQGQYVVHFLSLHEDGDFLVTRDVTGDMFWPEDWDFSPEDFDDLAREHLLSCPVDRVVISEPGTWPFPCAQPTREEIEDAATLSSVYAEIGTRAPEPPDDDSGPSGP